MDYYYNAYKINDVYIDKREEKRQTKKNKLVELTIPKTNFYSSSSSSSLSAFNTSHHHYSYFDEYYDADNNDSIMLDDDIMEQTQTNVSSLAATNPSDTTRALCVSCQKQKPVNSFNRYTNQAVTNPFSTNSNSSTSLVNRLSPVSFPIAAAPLVVREQHHVEEKLRIVENNRNSLFNKQFFQLNINAATATGSSSSSNFSQSSSKTTENMCNNCWIYWKKYGSFKNNFNEINALSKILKIYYIIIYILIYLLFLRKQHQFRTFLSREAQGAQQEPDLYMSARLLRQIVRQKERLLSPRHFLALSTCQECRDASAHLQTPG